MWKFTNPLLYSTLTYSLSCNQPHHDPHVSCVRTTLIRHPTQIKQKFERLTPEKKLSEMAPWTASGTQFLRSDAGMRRDAQTGAVLTEERAREVPNWVATNPESNLDGVAVHTPSDSMKPRAGRWASWPPDVRLPDDQQLVDAADFRWYGSSRHRLLAVLPSVVNLGPTLSPTTHVPEDQLLAHALRGELFQQIWRALLRPDGALDDVSTTLPPYEPTTFRAPDATVPHAPWTRRSVVNPSVSGWRARQQATNPTSFCRDVVTGAFAGLRRAVFQIHAPEAEDEMSASGMVSMQIKTAMRHGVKWPFDGAAGDGPRPGLSTDVGSQEQREANTEKLGSAVEAGAFETERKARSTVEVLGLAMAHDEVGAQMHLEMALIAHILKQNWKAASLSDLRERLRRTDFRPDKEAQAYRKKRELLDEAMMAYLTTQLRRFHSSGAATAAGITRSAGGTTCVLLRRVYRTRARLSHAGVLHRPPFGTLNSCN